LQIVVVSKFFTFTYYLVGNVIRGTRGWKCADSLHLNRPLGLSEDRARRRLTWTAFPRNDVARAESRGGGG